jgi:small subunit ribosomal protein S17
MSDKKLKTLIGQVVSDRMEKTIRVAVVSKKKHPRYNKYIPTRTVYFAHDEKNEAKEGDEVKITFTRPTSAKKRWKLDSILKVAD